MLLWVVNWFFPQASLDSLPDECLCLILERLSLSDVTRCKFVSRRWCHLIRTSKRIARFGQSWFADTSSPSGQILATSGSPSEISRFSQHLLVEPIRFPRYVVEAAMRVVAHSTSGVVLVYLVISNHEHYAYFVGNPVTGAWRLLPEPPFWCDIRRKEGRLIVHNNGHFQVFVFSFYEFNHYWSFLSRQCERGWIKCRFTEKESFCDDSGYERLNSSTLLASTNRHSLTYCRGVVQHRYAVENFLACYDQVSGRFYKVRVRFPRDVCSFSTPFIVGFRGRWILVSSTLSQNKRQFGLGAWEFQRNSSTWRELGRQVDLGVLPDDGDDDVAGVIKIEYHRFGNSVVVQTHPFSRAMAFEFDKGSWIECEMFKFKSNRYDFTTQFSFTPGPVNPCFSEKRSIDTYFRERVRELTFHWNKVKHLYFK